MSLKFVIMLLFLQRDDGMKNYLLVNKNFPHINPVECGEEECKPNHRYAGVRSYWLLHYIVSGKGTFTVNGVTHKLHAGQCFIIRPQDSTVYQSDGKEPWHYIWIGFSTGMTMPEILKSQPFFEGDIYKEIFSKMLGVVSRKNDRECFLCGCIAELLAHLFEENHSPLSATAQAMEQAKNCIESEYMFPTLTVNTLAERLHLNRSYFSTAFRQHTGVSPQEYLNRYRLERAAQLLQHSDMPISQIATVTGYTDFCNFSRMFKRRFNIPPSQYAKQHKI